MIDLNQFVKDREVLVPVKDNRFQFEKKKYKVQTSDGWYKVKLKGNDVEVAEPVFMFQEVEAKYDVVKGYSYNNSIIFHNFDVSKRKWKFQISRELHFNRSQSFNAIKGIVWEDKNVYFTEPDYTNYKIFDIKNAFDQERSLEDLKGVTPELRTLYIFHSLERDQLREMEKIKLEELALEERLERERQLMSTLQGRLQITFDRAGARLLQYNISGTRVTVDWQIIESGQRYNSVIDSNTFKVIEAGYCMSGEDKKHNITSLVKLAEDYDERGLIHITRN